MKRGFWIGCSIIGLFVLMGLYWLYNTYQHESWNNPHPKSSKITVYSSFSERPKTLDPGRSYSANEAIFTAQIYEPPLQYHYLKRPYELEPLAAAKMPTITYYDKAGHEVPENTPAQDVAMTVYDIQIKPGIQYQPHPAFAKDLAGSYLYHGLAEKQTEKYYTLQDFPKQGTRELVAEDYVYQIKRLAHPKVHSPIYGLMSEHILGFEEFAKTLKEGKNDLEKNPDKAVAVDLRKQNLAGAEVLDRYTYRIKIKGKYPQFSYWLAMPFFSPMPWEAEVFYGQPGLAERNISLDWYPVGTGPYLLAENNPNQRMVLEKNPNFRGEVYPQEGEESDHDSGYLSAAGLPIPFVDKFVFSLEKETIPRWNKFLQGYYDQSAISSDSFDEAIQVDEKGEPHLTQDMTAKGISLQTTITPSIFYLGFNMLDPLVGGNSEKSRKLRQAIAIAVDYEEFISIFMNGRGVSAHGPLPPGVFGREEGEKGINPYVYDWKKGKAQRKPLSRAKELLKEAGYPNGRNAKTGKPLVLNYDVVSSSGPDDHARYAWMRKQFKKLGIQLNIRATSYNRFQEKLRTGNMQIFSLGWLADYPDPENFFFLLYGPNGKVKSGGENPANYSNKKYDELYDVMVDLPNGPERQAVIGKMLDLLQADTPWIWGVHPKDFILSHHWMTPGKPNAMANNTLKYKVIDVAQRDKEQKFWNMPVLWPFIVLALLIITLLVPVILRYRRKIHNKRERK